MYSHTFLKRTALQVHHTKQENCIMKKEKNKNFLHSISAKITLVTVAVIFLSQLVSLINAETSSKSALLSTNENYIYSLAETSAEIIESMGKDENTADYAQFLADIHMKGDRIFLRISGFFRWNHALSSYCRQDRKTCRKFCSPECCVTACIRHNPWGWCCSV